MSKMAMSYVILAVCITFQTAQANTLGNLANSLLLASQNLPDKLYQGLKLVREGVNSAIEQSKQSIDQTIAELSHERNLVQNARDSLLKDAKNAKPCDKLMDISKANIYSLYVSCYNCVLKGLVLAKSENTNITKLSNDLLNELDQKLPGLTKCVNESDLLSKYFCLLNNTASDATLLAPLFEKFLALFSEYLTILPDTALCIGQSLPKDMLDKNLLEDAELCIRSYAQSLICDKTDNLYKY